MTSSKYKDPVQAIGHLRKHGIAISTLAEVFSVSRQTLWAWGTARTAPPAEARATLQHMATVLKRFMAEDTFDSWDFEVVQYLTDYNVSK